MRYGLSNEQLAMRLVELLAERTTQNGRIFSRWATRPKHGRRVFAEFVDQLGHVDARGQIDELRTSKFGRPAARRQRLKHIDSRDRETLTGSPRGAAKNLARLS
jgi:hypothetical protein